MGEIQLEDLEKSYGQVRAVDRVTLTVQQGQFVTLLGPSGSGKTTTMRMIAGLDRPDAGTIRIGARVVNAKNVFVPPYRRNLGMVFQSYAIWPHMTVRDNVAFPLQQRGVSRPEQQRRVGQILERVGLGALAARYPSQLSGGQQQRVSLARALVAEPDVILFDEPLSNLDAKLRDEMRTLLTTLQRDLRLTSVYVTHDQNEAMVLSDQVYIMNAGRLVQGGTPQELYREPASLFVARFVGQANVLNVTELDVAGKKVCLDSGDVLNVAHIHADPRERVLVIRPHHVVMANGEGANTLEGVVRVVSYLGDRVRYTLAVGERLALEMEAVSVDESHPVGSRMRVVLPPHLCRVF